MKKIKVGMVDNNKELTEILKDFIEKQEDMEVDFVVHNGKEGLEELKKHNSDILLLDIILPEIDGLGVLEEMKEIEGNSTKVIIFTSLNKEEIKKQAMELGAAYYILKPFDFSMLIRRIKGITNEKQVMKEESLEQRVALLVKEAGFPLHVKGYIYIKEAILMVYHDTKHIGSITKTIYPDIAKRYNTTSSCVERAIRHAIDVAWTQKEEKKPKNGEFIAKMAEELKFK